MPKSPAQTVKLVILGRDGILNVFREDHVKEPAEWVPMPGALEAVARLNQAGWHAVVATNQSGIGRGMIDMAAVNQVHLTMSKLLAERGARLDAVFFCPHAPEDQCTCRKPLPGMMQDIAERYGVELPQVPMVGDTLRDLQAAQAAGCHPHLVRQGRASALSEALLGEWLAAVPQTTVHDDLTQFAAWLLSREAAARGRSTTEDVRAAAALGGAPPPDGAGTPA
jgi:D-glycero-D-manno-heptose 1,7-bisphosphate phosphatase